MTIEYGYTHRAAGRHGLHQHTGIDPAQLGPQTVRVIFDGNLDVYDRPDDLDDFRLWAESVWEEGTSRDLHGTWSDNTLYLEDHNR